MLLADAIIVLARPPLESQKIEKGGYGAKQIALSLKVAKPALA
jgi:hypothetical protein